MLFPVIKDLNYIITNFLQRIYISSTSLRDYYADWKLNSLSGILPNFPSSETIDTENPVIFWLKAIIFFLLKIQAFIVYFFSFKWLALADYAYLNISVPENFWKSLPKVPPIYEYSNWVFLMLQKGTRFLEMLEETIGYTLFSKILKDPFFYEDYNYIKYPPNMDKTNMVFSDSYVTISNLPKTLLEPSWFDSITTPMQIFGLPGVEYEQLTKAANESGWLNQSNWGFLGFLLIPMAISIFFSSFLNSFFVNFPLSISRFVSLRYFNISSPYYQSQEKKREHSDVMLPEKKSSFVFGGDNALENFKISLLSVFGLVLGEMSFIFLLIVPPPYIQFTLSYLDSIWPYVLGLVLVVLIIGEGSKTNLVHVWLNNKKINNVSLHIKRKPFKAFLLCFLLSLTEQSCCFSYFGSFNLNSTGNFFDTYIFSASLSPILFIFSCLGFFIGSVLAMIIYNFCLSQLLYFLFLAWKRKKTILHFLFIRLTSWSVFSSFASFGTFWSSGQKGKTLLPGSLSGIANSLLFLLQSYKRMQPVNRFFNFFSEINSYFSSLFTLLITKITRNQNAAYRQTNYLKPQNKEIAISSTEMPVNTLYYNSFNFSVYSSFFSPQALTAKPQQKKQPMFKIENLKTETSLNWSILTGIDQFLVICLVLFSFTTIPFYSMDFVVHKFFGFIPHDQILNNYNLSNTTIDYGENIDIEIDLGTPAVPGLKNIYTILDDIALFDQNNYGNVVWKTHFEDLNYRHTSQFLSIIQQYNKKKHRMKFLAPSLTKYKRKWLPSLWSYFQNTRNQVKSLESKKIKKNLFLVDPKDFLKDHLRKKNIRNFEEAFSVISSKVLNSNPDRFSGWSQYWGPRIMLDQPIQYVSDVTFSSLTTDEFVTEVYDLNAQESKKKFALKYYQNPIIKIILSNDLKNFLKHQPLSQQLTDVQEKDLALLRVKMAHYYDSLRFYFNLKNHVHKLKNSFEQTNEPVTSSHSRDPLVNKFAGNDNSNKNSSNRPFNLKPNHRRTDLFYKNLQFPPMIAKSISSLNYHQQFKGTYEIVRELYDISLYNNNISTYDLFPEETYFSDSLSKKKLKSNITDHFSTDKIQQPYSHFALPIQNFDKQAQNQALSKSFQTPEESISQMEDHKKTNSDVSLNNASKKNLKDFRLSKIKEASLGVADSLISRVKNRLYQIDSDLVSHSTKNFLPSDGWLADRKALLSYDKSLFNEYDYNLDHFLHEEAKVINSKDDSYNISNLKTSNRSQPLSSFLDTSSVENKKHFNRISDSNSSLDQQSIKDFKKMDKKGLRSPKESTNPFYVGWDKNLRKFILTSRIIHRPYYLTKQTQSNENLQSNKSYLNNGWLSKLFRKKRWLSANQKSLKHYLRTNDFSHSKPQNTEYYSSWPFMGDKITSFKSNKYSGLYTNRRFISDNPKIKPWKNLQTYYYENFPAIGLIPYEMLQDYSELFNYYYYKNNKSIKQVFPRLYMPSNLFKYYTPEINFKQSLLRPTSSSFVWSGTEDITSNYPIALLVNIEKKFLGYDRLSLDQKSKERQKYRMDHLKGSQINFNFNKKSFLLKKFITKKIRQFIKVSNLTKVWYYILDFQNHITRNFEIDEYIQQLLASNYQLMATEENVFISTEYLYPQEVQEDFFSLPNHEYPEKLQYTNNEIRTIQKAYDDEIIYPNDYQKPRQIERSLLPNF